MIQPIQRSVQRLILLREVQTHNIVDRFIEERAARHGADAGFSRQLLAEVDVALAFLRYGEMSASTKYVPRDR